MRSFLLFLSLILIPPFTFCQELTYGIPEEQGFSTQRLNRLTTRLNQYVEENELPGTVTLVARNGQIVYHEAHGYSNISDGTLMEKDALFRIASQTKAIISVGVMMLQEEGKLLISDPISEYLPAFAETKVVQTNEDGGYDIVDAERPITIRDLLTHTAGIGYGWGPAANLWQEAGIQGWYFADRDQPIQEVINELAALPNEAQPGERFVYGYNTDILGALIEVVSGQSLDEFLEESIFQPLGMEDTFFFVPEQKVDRLTTVYSTTQNGLQEAPKEGTMQSQGHYVDGPRMCFSGGAGLVSTATDYASFLQMMLNDGVYNGHQLLSPKTVQLMQVSHIDESLFLWAEGVGFGLGFATTESLGERGKLGTKGEYGWGGAYHTSYWIDPVEQLIVVYMTQVIPADGLKDHDIIRNLIYQSLIDSYVTEN